MIQRFVPIIGDQSDDETNGGRFSQHDLPFFLARRRFKVRRNKFLAFFSVSLPNELLSNLHCFRYRSAFLSQWKMFRNPSTAVILASPTSIHRRFSASDLIFTSCSRHCRSKEDKHRREPSPRRFQLPTSANLL